MSRRKCTVQRCQGTPSTWAMAALRPGWASESVEAHSGQSPSGAGHAGTRARSSRSLPPRRRGR
jgi:hypothetical protein